MSTFEVQLKYSKSGLPYTRNNYFVRMPTYTGMEKLTYFTNFQIPKQ